MLKMSDNQLRKMFLLSEPAFKKYKEDLENEKYLSILDKEMKSILNDRKTPPYKKWLRYNDAFLRFSNFKNLLSESKKYHDMENTRKLTELEKQIKMLQKYSNKNDSILDSTKLSKYDVSDESIIQPEEDSYINKTLGKKSQDISPEDTMYSFTPDEESEESKEDSGEIQRAFDNDVLETNSPLERISNMQPELVDEMKVNGKIPTMFLAITYIDEMDEEQRVSINVMNTRITKNGVILTQDADHNRIGYHNVLTHDLDKVRNALVLQHNKIDNIIEKYHSKKVQNIPIRRYKLKDKNEKETFIQLKGQFYTVPNAILDQVTKVLDTENLSPSKIKIRIDKLKKNYITDKRRAEHSQSFFSPFNQTTDDLNISSLPSNKTFRPKLSAGSTPRKTKTSTPARRTLTKPRTTLLQSTLDNYNYKKTKNILNQDGKGVRQKWEKI